MANFNKVIVVGRLTRDIELRYSPKGTAIAQVDLAVNRTWTGDDGEKKEEVCFVSATSFGKTAEVMGQYLKKGVPILIEGRLRTESWEDKQSGQKRQKLSVVIETFQFMGSKPEGDQEERPAKARSTKPKESEPAGDDEPDLEDKVPF